MVTQTVPENFLGSLPEFIAIQEFTKAGLVLGIDYTFQSPLFGGRLEKGGVIIDFLFFNPPNLAINIQGVYFHYELGGGTRARDEFARAQLAGEGITLIFVDEDDLLEDPTFFITEALQYRDRSRMSGG